MSSIKSFSDDEEVESMSYRCYRFKLLQHVIYILIDTVPEVESQTRVQECVINMSLSLVEMLHQK